MKKIWSNNPEEIHQEIERLARQQTPLILSQPDSESQAVTVKAIKKRESHALIILQKLKPFIASQQQGYLFYRPLEIITRLFPLLPVKDSDAYLAAVMPKVIMEIPRRKYPRVDTPYESKAVFTIRDYSKLFQGETKDISQEGSLLRSTFSPTLNNGTILSPVTLSLFVYAAKAPVTEIIVPAAKIVKTFALGDKMDIALHFTLSGKELDTLEDYIERRLIEDSTMHDDDDF